MRTDGMVPAYVLDALKRDAAARYAAADAARPRVFAYAPCCPGCPGDAVSDGPVDGRYDAPAATSGVVVMVL